MPDMPSVPGVPEMPADPSSRDHDVVLFGATGFVGRLTAAHLARSAPAGTRIALAGRSREKVEAIRASLDPAAAAWPVLVADSTDAESLRALARSARVVVSTVGPYVEHGTPLVRACAEAGSHYADLTGEVAFVRRTIDEVDGLARRTGSRIVHSCGFDSVPSDLAVMMLADRVAADGAGTLGETTSYVWLRGGVSGGTVASMRRQVVDMASDDELARLVHDPHGLSPDRAAEPTGEHGDGDVRPHRASAVGAWVAPFLMAPYNTRVVRRSNALLGHRYGSGFRYQEAMVTGRGAKGAVLAGGTVAALAALGAAMTVPALAPALDRLLPAPGEGPSEKAQASGRFRLDARTTTSTGARYRAVVAADRDPGYSGTAVMLGEAALALALDELPAAAGVLTPATGIGPALVTRLAEQGFVCGTARLP